MKILCFRLHCINLPTAESNIQVAADLKEEEGDEKKYKFFYILIN